MKLLDGLKIISVRREPNKPFTKNRKLGIYKRGYENYIPPLGPCYPPGTGDRRHPVSMGGVFCFSLLVPLTLPVYQRLFEDILGTPEQIDGCSTMNRPLNPSRNLIENPMERALSTGRIAIFTRQDSLFRQSNRAGKDWSLPTYLMRNQGGIQIQWENLLQYLENDGTSQRVR